VTLSFGWPGRIRQAAILGLPGITAAGIGASAACDSGEPKLVGVGVGVAGGPSKIIGRATITETHGKDTPNPVFEFDGAIDPSS
jgi:hypothetical protein